MIAVDQAMLSKSIDSGALDGLRRSLKWVQFVNFGSIQVTVRFQDAALDERTQYIFLGFGQLHLTYARESHSGSEVFCCLFS